MKKLAGKTKKILGEQGVRGFCYVASQKIKNRLSEQQKYACYVRREKKRRARCAQDIQTEIQIALLHVGADIFSAIEEAAAPYVAFLEDGMTLADGWQAVVGAHLLRHPQQRFLYTDEDVCAPRRTRPIFKPDWSPDTYLSYDYVGGLLILERQLAVQAKEQIFHKYRESFLYELGLRAAALLAPEEIGHIDEVLCHRTEKKEVPKAQLMELKKTFLREQKIPGRVVWCEEAHAANVVYAAPPDARVSIIVPSKDHAGLLQTCIGSVERLTAAEHVEWIVVDNGSAPQERARYEALCAGTRYPCKYVYEPMPFNFSRMCNLGAAASSGDYLLFLNDDMELPAKWPSMHGLTETTQGDWLAVLVGQAAQARTGAVGAKLLYPDSDKIQHLGVVNYTSGAAHLLWQASDAERLPFDRNLTNQNYAIVTAACLLVSAEKFAQVGGFDERLAVTFNDVEFCLKLLEAGYYNVVRSDVVLYHHESLSRGRDVLDEAKFLRGLKERETLFDLHPAWIGVDPYYSRHLTQTRLDHLLDYPPRLVFGKKKKTMPEGEEPFSAQTREAKMKARILRVRCEDMLTIEGWAYRPGKGSERVTVWLTDAHGSAGAYGARQIYSPTLATQQERKERLFFSEFLLCLPTKALAPGRYDVALQIKEDFLPTDASFVVPDNAAGQMRLQNG